MARGKLKIRLKSGLAKGKKWRKGHSSDNNPEARSHREMAKNRFLNTKSGPSALTAAALARHEAATADLADPEREMDAESVGSVHSAKTFKTWASNWTECTSATFSRVHRQWSANSALHTEMLAVLAAVTEVIKQQGGTESETAYFAALMTTLESTESETTSAATAYLLYLAVKRVPVPVLRSRFSEVSRSLLTALAARAKSNSALQLKYLILVLAHVLRSQPAHVWTYASTSQLYSALLAFTTSPLPRVRKAVQQAVRVLLKASALLSGEGAPAHHPGAPHTAKYCTQQLENSAGGDHAALHTLSLLQHVMCVLPASSTKSCCETLLRLLTLANPLVTASVMRCLHSLFSAAPPETCLSAQLNAKILTALHDFQPSSSDAQQTCAWLVTMQSGHLNLHRLGSSVWPDHVARLFTVCMQCLGGSAGEQVCKQAASTAQALLRECVGPSAAELAIFGAAVSRMFSAAQAGLSYQYHQSWARVLAILTTFIQVYGEHSPDMITKVLEPLASLRDSPQFAYTQEVDTALGAALKTLGARRVLQAVPLNINAQGDDLSLRRSWLLSVLREHLERTELGYFTSNLLPLAAKLRTAAVERQSRGENVLARTYDVLQQQVWSLLPGFCTRPTDFATAFPDIARLLGMALSDRDDLRVHVMSALRRLLAASSDSAEMKNVLCNFAKNYLPILFNLYCKEAEAKSSRQAALDTIKAYLPTTPPQLVHSYLDRCLSKLEEPDTAGQKQLAYMDLLTSMVPWLDETRLSSVYDWVTPKLQSSERAVQKKSFAVIQRILDSDSSACVEFVADRLGVLQTLLVSSLGTAAQPAATTRRLLCIQGLLKHLKDPDTELITAILPEAVRCVRGSGERAVAAASTLLLSLVDVLSGWSGGEAGRGLEALVLLVGAGLQGGVTPHRQASTAAALSVLVRKHSDLLRGPVLDSLMSVLLTLLSARTRDAVSESLRLASRLVARLPDTALAPQLSGLTAALTTLPGDSRARSRLPLRALLARLLAKFGLETMLRLLPEEFHKQLRNVHKAHARELRHNKQRGKEARGDKEIEHRPTGPRVESIDDLLADSDSEPDESAGRDSKGRGAGRAWLSERGEDSIIDFLDTSVSSRVLAMRPGSAAPGTNTTGGDRGFRKAPDGRLIITEEGEDSEEGEEGAKKKRVALKRRRQREEDEEHVNEILDALSGQHRKNKRSREAHIEKSGAEEGGDVEDWEVSHDYRPGGTGIHRPLTAPVGAQPGNQPGREAGKEQPRTPGSEYRAKKAGGDVKRKGRPDPYAYIPFDMKLLNRRKKAKAAGTLKHLVAGAKRGSQRGCKAKRARGKTGGK